MLGYHVFYSVTGSKKSYNTTEFYLFEKDARKRALELSVASNIRLVILRDVDVKPINLEVIKGNVEL